MAWKQFDDERFTAIADAIRSKGRTTETIKVGELASSISNLPDYTNKWLSILDRSVTEITDEDMAGVTQVREHLFLHCYKLEKCALPEGITAIGGGCFLGDLKLKNIKLPSTLSVLEDEAFMDCTSLTSVTLPAELRTTGTHIFSGCTSLTDVRIEEGSLHTLSLKSFYDCTSLTNIVLPSSITAIGSLVFLGCSKLVTIECRATTPPTLADATSLPGTSIVKLIFVPYNSVDAYKAAPYWSDYADKIYGTKIGMIVNGTCYSLTADDFVGITKLKDELFTNHTFNNVEFSNTIQVIGAYTFNNASFASLVLPDSITDIGNNISNDGGAFRNNKLLSNVAIGTGIVLIHKLAFADCPKLKTVICKATTPPDITEDAFSGTTVLEKIYVPVGCVSAYESATGWSQYAGKIFEITSDVDVDTTGRPGTLYDTRLRDYFNMTITDITINDLAGCSKISVFALAYLRNIQSLMLPESITSLSYASCYTDTSLTNIVIPSTCTLIGDVALANCNNLTTIECRATTPPTLTNATSLPGTSIVKYIYVPAASVDAYKAAPYWSDYADIIYGTKFAHAVGREVTHLTADDFYYPSNYALRDSLFQNDISLKSVEFSNKIISIGSWSFANTGLTSIVIPDSVTIIGLNNAGNCFYMCPLTKIVIGTGVTTINPNSFYTESTTYTIICKAVEPPALGNDSVFNPLSRVAHIYVPADSVDTYKAASRWSNYASVIEAITDDINVDTTGRSGQLVDLKMQNYVRRLSTEVTKEELGSINKVGYSAFGYFRSLTYASLPDTINTILGSAFNNCTALTTVECRSTTPPALGTDVFLNCTALKYIYVPADSVEAYKTADRWSEYADKIYGSKMGHVLSRTATNLTADDFAGVTALGTMICSWSLLSQIELSNTITTIGSYTFQGSLIQSIVIPDSVTDFGSGSVNIGSCFADCPKLLTIVIGTGLLTTGIYAFNNCAALTTVACKATTPPNLGGNSFGGCTALAHIYVPSDSVSAYKSAANWSDYASIIEAMPDEYANIDTVGRPGTLWDKRLQTYLNHELTYINVDEFYNATTIYQAAFFRQSNLVQVDIPSTVTSLGYYSFCLCSSLLHLLLPSSITKLGTLCIVNDLALTTIECRATTPPSFGSYAISNNPKLKYIYVPADSVEAYKAASGWSDYADIIYGTKFAHAVSRDITYLTVDDMYSDIGTFRDFCFYLSLNLKKIEIPNTYTKIAAHAFRACKNIEYIMIPDSVTLIGLNNAGYSFSKCEALKTLAIGTGITTINNNCFDKTTTTTPLTVICKATTPPSITSTTFTVGTVEHIYVPSASVAAYKADDNWSAFADIIEAITDEVDIDTTGRAPVLVDDMLRRYIDRDLTNVSATDLAGITKIGYAAFYISPKLITVELPSTITSLDAYAIAENANLTTITCYATTPPSFGSYAINNNPKLKYIYVPADSVSAYKAASGWSDYADIIYGTKFAHAVNREITTLTADDLAGAKFRNYVFAGTNKYPNNSLVSLEIPNTFTSIEAQAFLYCHALKQVIIPDSVTTMGNNNTGNSFVNCVNLSLIVIGTGITTFNGSDFYRSNTDVPLTVVIKQTTPPAISISTFPYATSGIVKHIYVPEESVDAYKAADNWSDYASVIEVMPDEYAKIDTTGRPGTQWDAMMGKYLMRGIYDITEDMLSGITTIGCGAFSFWTGLNSIAIPEGVTAIDNRAFASCSKLTSLTLPSTLTYLGDYCFNSTSKLTTLTCLATTPPTIDGANIGLPAITNIYVPSASVDAYKAAPYWSDYADIIEAIPVIYGFHVDSTNSSPSGAVTYLEEAVGKTPAYMDYTNNVFNYGDWEDAFFMPRPCMLKSDGTVDYYLNPNDYTLKVDGTASDVANVDYDGNAMMEWGIHGQRIWYKIVPDDDPTSYSVYFSNHLHDDDYVCWSFYNKNNELKEHFYTPIYSGSLDSNNKLRSLSGMALMQSKTATQEMSYALANGDGWNIEVWSDKLLMFLLLYLMGKSLNLQATFGLGHSSGGSSTTMINTGELNDKGLFFGYNTTSEHKVKVFGMEDQWAEQWNRVAGLMLDTGVYKYKMTEGTADGSTVFGYQTTSTTGMLDGGAGPTTNGYVTKMSASNNIILPNTIGGNSATYYCDYYYQNASGVRFALLGGSSVDGPICGFYVRLYASAAGSSWAIGAALSCKPIN